MKGTVAGLLERTEAEREATEPFVDRVFDPDRFPTVARVGPSPVPSCRPRPTRSAASSSGRLGFSTGWRC